MEDPEDRLLRVLGALISGHRHDHDRRTTINEDTDHRHTDRMESI